MEFDKGSSNLISIPLADELGKDELTITVILTLRGPVCTANLHI